MSEENTSQLPAEPVAAVTKTPPPARRASAPPIALLALAVSIGTVVGGYFIWHEVQRLNTWQQHVLGQIDARAQGLDQRLASFKDRLDSDLAASERSRRSAEEEQRKLGTAQAGMEDALAVLRAQLGRSQDQWILAETQYLLQVANQRLQLQRDASTAIMALRSADQRLQTIADPGFNAVREQIAHELTALSAVAQPDLAGISLTLDTLATQAMQWPLKDRHALQPMPVTQTQTATTLAAAVDDWRSRIASVAATVWDALRSLVVVRHNGEPLAPMLAPDQEFFLHENLRLQLSIARLSALQGAADSYRASLKTASAWLKNHFAMEAPVVIAAHAELQRLAALEVQPELPDISASLRLLRQQMQNASVGGAAP